MKLVGRDVVKGLPGEITLTSAEVAPLATTFFETIITQARSIMEHTPPEISMDIKERGIYLTGGSSEIHGLAAMLQTKTGGCQYLGQAAGNGSVRFGVFCRAWQTGSKICNAYEIRMQFEEGSEDA